MKGMFEGRYLDGPSGWGLTAVEGFETLHHRAGLGLKVVHYSLKKRGRKPNQKHTDGKLSQVLVVWLTAP